MKNKEKTLIVLGVCLLGLLAFSGIKPYDRGTWFLEVLPVLIALPLMVITYRRFPLTSLLYALILIHAVVLIAGGTYTYARVPLGSWMQEMLSLERNPYDKIGHFMQGLVPVLVAREILLRGAYVKGRRMMVFLSVCVVLAVSAFYELIEWWVALGFGEGAESFLGTQGDPWDTQSDMFMALLGAITGLALFSRLHDRQIAALTKKKR